MKFGKQLESYKIPEWFEYYLDYNGIKTILKFLDNRPSKRKKLKKLKMIKLKYDKYQKTKPPNESKRKVSIFSNESTSLIVASSHKLKKYKSKRKRIIEAEDLSSLPDEEKIANFTNIYRNKIKIVDEFFTNKLQEFLGELNRIEFKINSLDTSSSSEESYVGEKKKEPYHLYIIRLHGCTVTIL